MHSLQAFIEAVDWEKLQQVREDARVQEEQEHQEEAKEFHAEFGSDEEIYSQAKKAAAEYLSELGVEDEEEEGAEEEDGEDEYEGAREPTEEEWDDAPGIPFVNTVLSAVYIRVSTSSTIRATQMQCYHSCYSFLLRDCIGQQFVRERQSLSRPALQTMKLPEQVLQLISCLWFMLVPDSSV